MGGTWDRASERRVYPAIALSPDLNHSIRNQNSLKRESARVLFTRSVPSTRTDGRTDRRQQRPHSGLLPHTRSRGSGSAPRSTLPSATTQGSFGARTSLLFTILPIERALQVPKITRHAAANANTRNYLKNDTRGTTASPSTRDTLPAESPGDDGFILPCLSDPSLAGNPRTMAEPARPH